MRAFEILLVLITFLSLLRWTRPGFFPVFWPQIFLAATAAFSLLHFTLEGYRWQMIPVYFLVAASFIQYSMSLLQHRRGRAPQNPPRPPRRWLHAAFSVLGMLLVALAAAPPILLPVPSVPAPGGPYPVGTYSVMVVDETRREIYSGDPSDPRRLMVQIWYPAQPERSSQHAPWVEDFEVVAPAIAAWIRLPSFFLDHVGLARTHAYASPPLNQVAGQMPVLLFSHGWGGFRAQNTFQAEDLASHGYLVAAVEHTYASAVTVFPDGSTAEHNPAGLPSGVSAEEYVRAANQLLDQWAGDLDYVLKYLDELNKNDPAGRFTAHLDLERVGVLGHSTGGGATVQFCARQPRCRAALGMDAYLVPVTADALESGITQPALYLSSEAWPTTSRMRANNSIRLNQLLAASSGPAIHLTIAGTAHYDFTDLPALSPLAPQLKLKGPLPGPRVAQIVRSYGLAFFDSTLRGQSSELLDGPSGAFPEVTWEPIPSVMTLP